MLKSVQSIVVDEDPDWTLLRKKVRRLFNHVPETILPRQGGIRVFSRLIVAAAGMRCLRRSLQRAFLSAWISPSIWTASFKFA